jgi:predicted dehydrogenase
VLQAKLQKEFSLMKQVIRKGLKDIIVDEIPDPVVTPHHILVRPLCSLISSGTETASIHHEGLLKAVADNPSQLQKIWEVLKVNSPLRTFAEIRAKFSEYAVLGYSGAGVVVEKHSTVTDLGIGDHVSYGGEGTGHGETILVGRNLVGRVPPAVPFEHACFATVGSIALNAVRAANLNLGESVAVLGLGLVGQLVAQLARLQGGTVIALDLKPDRVELARHLGADHSFVADASPEHLVASLTSGRGVDCVIVAAAAKSPVPCRQAVAFCRDRGRIVDVGAVDLVFPWYEMYLKEIRFFMARAYGPGSYDPTYEEQGHDYPFAYVRWTENRNMEEFLRLVAAGRVQLAPLITHRFALADAARAYQTILDPASNSLAVVLDYPAAAAPDVLASYIPTRRVATEQKISSQSLPFTSTVGVALVGAGNLARWAHLPALKKVLGTKLRAVYSASGVRARSYALRFGADYCTSEYEEVLKDPQVHVVLVLSRNQHHASQALRALHAGKHVFVEKPMTLTEEECRELVYAVRDTGRHLTVGFNRRFAPFYKEFKRHLVRRPGPAVLNCRINSPGISGSYWMADPSQGGAILGEACHFVDLMYWLLESEPLTVSAYSFPPGTKQPIGSNNLAATFRFADGSVGNLTYCTVGSRTSGGERVEAFAEGLGVMTEDFKRLSIRTSMTRRRSRFYADKGYFPQLEDFFASIREGRRPAITVEDGARSTIGCLRMLESARKFAPANVNWEEVIS